MKRIKNSYLPVDGSFPFLGLDTMTPSTQLAPGSSPNSVNLSTFRGSLKKRVGYGVLGGQINGGAETILQLIDFQKGDGTTVLIACTATKVYYFDGVSWNDVTPVVTVVKLAKVSGGNGWSITSGSFTAGQAVLQPTSYAASAGASGIWLTPDASFYYIAVTYGVFNATDGIQLAPSLGSGVLSLSGTDPGAVTKTLAKFPKLSAGVGWAIFTGVFDPGTAVIQDSSGATGVWQKEDASFYYVSVTSGTFDDVHDVVSSVAGKAGTLTATGTSGAATTTTKTYGLTTTMTSPWHGSEDHYIDSAIGTDLNLGKLVILTNGVDWPIYWDGALGTFKLVPVTLRYFISAKAVAYFNGYFIFANIKTSLDNEPQTSMWSDTGNIQDWLGGNSGVLANMNFSGEILRLIPFTTNLIVFSQNTIGCLCYIDPVTIFGSQIYVTDISVVGPGAISNISPFIFYIGQDNVYIWDGNRSISPIGDRIANVWRSIQDKNYIGRTKLFHDTTLSQVKFLAPTGATTNRTFILELADTASTLFRTTEPGNIRWFESSYNNRIIAFGRHNTVTNGVQFIDPVMASTSGYVFYQETQPYDFMYFDNVPVLHQSPILVTWETGDFVLPMLYQSQLARWLEFEFEALGLGDGLEVLYSLDEGQHWTSLGITQLTDQFAEYILRFDVTTRKIRFKFYLANNSIFELRWYRVWFRPGGAR